MYTDVAIHVAIDLASDDDEKDILPDGYSSLSLLDCSTFAEKVGRDLGGSVLDKGAGPILTRAKEEVQNAQH